MNLAEDYSEVWEEIEKKRIPKNKIDEILLRTLLKIIQEIEERKRNELDIGDIFGLGIQHAMGKGYKLNPEVEDFLCYLGCFDESDCIEEIKKRTYELLDKEIDKSIHSKFSKFLSIIKRDLLKI